LTGRTFFKAAVVFGMIVAAFATLSPEDISGELAPPPAPGRTALPPVAADAPFLEIVAVPPDATSEEAQKKLESYLRSRYPEGPSPSIVAVAARSEEEAYRPLPFRNERDIRFVATNAGHNIVPYDPACRCDPTGATTALADSLPGRERRALSLLVLRSALYRYAEDHEFALPATLDGLTKVFPGNYVSQVPDFEGEALVYRPERFRKHAMWASLAEVLALEGAPEAYVFEEPITLKLYKGSSRLAAESGRDVLREYPVTIGKPDSPTPNGMFQVELRVNEPISSTRLFGTRALSFARGEYAIHGTNDPAAVGEPLSNGCVRLTNESVEELFALTPLGTTIAVVEGPSPHPDDVPSARYDVPARDDETSKRTYRWRG
jgi:hypothetical protein